MAGVTMPLLNYLRKTGPELDGNLMHGGGCLQTEALLAAEVSQKIGANGERDLPGVERGAGENCDFLLNFACSPLWLGLSGVHWVVHPTRSGSLRHGNDARLMTPALVASKRWRR